MNFPSYGYRPCAWLEHWTNGGTGVTRISADRSAFYHKVVEEFGDPRIFLSPDGLELHSCKLQQGKQLDLSDFWEFFRKLENNSTKTLPE